MIEILELGCGKGRNASVLAKRQNTTVTGVDLSSDNIAMAKNSHPNVNFFVMPAEKLEFPDSKFDEVHAFDIYEHVDDFPIALRETVRVMKPGGKLIVNVPAPKSEEWLLKVRPSYFKEIHHVRIFRGTELQDIAEQNGLRMTKKEARDFSDHVILYYVFKTTKNSDSQLGVGNWRDSLLGKILFGMHAFTKPELVFTSPLKYIPFWIITLPIGIVVNFIGNRFFPKSMRYEFIKL